MLAVLLSNAYSWQFALFLVTCSCKNINNHSIWLAGVQWDAASYWPRQLGKYKTTGDEIMT